MRQAIHPSSRLICVTMPLHLLRCAVVLDSLSAGRSASRRGILDGSASDRSSVLSVSDVARSPSGPVARAAIRQARNRKVFCVELEQPVLNRLDGDATQLISSCPVQSGGLFNGPVHRSPVVHAGRDARPRSVE